MRIKRKHYPKADLTGTVSGLSQDTATVSQIYRQRQSEPEAPETPTVPQPGDRFGRYRLCDRLGCGVSCFVFRAWDELNDHPVAVKILNWENVVDRTAALRQMRTEAAALARVSHPRVIRFIDLGYDPRWPYLVTEYIDGRPLGELLRTGGALPPDWAAHVIAQAADGLGAVWRAGLVHRDVKPDNLLVGQSGVTKLIDFGLAKSPALQAAAGQTGPEVAGTAAYVSPEQAKDASVVDFRADVYSLGVTFYEALTGRLPFEGKNKMQMLFHHLNTEPTPPAKVNRQVPRLASDLCVWMLAKDPARRPQAAEVIRATIDAMLGG
jgi:serine/threonine-protein kinase